MYISKVMAAFLNNTNSNSIGNYIGKTAPTITTGNYFAWEVKYKSNDYFLDSTTGEIISNSNTKRFG